ncbi:GPW/gp25 family protein [Hymenobacter crusticola]|uniref:IraD/Gp25-like domain-containing protein n=1 Tax=Hymenobacter crusticola TaxID=1770526 RepID=A0A243WGY1_9BACT|nr:GPW/gp25 family protein [Hymenobacter crusticola]OUJ74798.1 hypothetical protein BXP70_08565 [Hymenobacter crusticola]
MSHLFYKYPMQVGKLMNRQPAAAPFNRPAPAARLGDEHATCSLAASIAQFLHLMLHTRPGELRSAPDFGCAIWEIEFDNDINLAGWEESLTRSLLASIRRHEPRLREVSVQVDFLAVTPQPNGPQPTAARRRANISVRGVVQLTDEAFAYATQLQLGQLTP